MSLIKIHINIHHITCPCLRHDRFRMSKKSTRSITMVSYGNARKYSLVTYMLSGMQIRRVQCFFVVSYLVFLCRMQFLVSYVCFVSQMAHEQFASQSYLSWEWVQKQIAGVAHFVPLSPCSSISGKLKRWQGRFLYRTKAYKKAYVRLNPRYEGAICVFMLAHDRPISKDISFVHRRRVTISNAQGHNNNWSDPKYVYVDQGTISVGHLTMK